MKIQVIRNVALFLDDGTFVIPFGGYFFWNIYIQKSKMVTLIPFRYGKKIIINTIKDKINEDKFNLVMVMVFNVTFNNISVISWQSLLLVGETGVPWENHRPAASHWQTISQSCIKFTPAMSRIRTHNLSGDRHSLRYI